MFSLTHQGIYQTICVYLMSKLVQNSTKIPMNPNLRTLLDTKHCQQLTIRAGENRLVQ